MSKMKFFAFAVLVFALGASVLAAAQADVRTPGVQRDAAGYQAAPAAAVRLQGRVITPASSVARPEDAGKTAHTNYHLFAPEGRDMATISPDNTFAEYPGSIGCVYKVAPIYSGCVPGAAFTHPGGGWGAIALVDAYDNPNILSDLNYFDSYFAVPAIGTKFTKVYANSSFGAVGSLGLTASCSGAPAGNTGWGLEEALDVEWAHVMAPAAKIILVEACSNSYNDLLVAEYVAGLKVAAAGGGDVSNSWGSGEFAGENTFDNYFFRDHWQRITYFASAGDSGWGAAYPSSSPWVVSAGGTTINRDANGNFLSESCWGGSGGGVSTQEMTQSPPNIANGMGPWANFQYPFGGAYPGPRQTPDMSFDADPASGVWVYDTYGGGSWWVVGGTSVSSPALAGLVNAANNRLGQAPTGGGFYATMENNLLYSQLSTNVAYKANFYDVTTGSNGAAAVAGYDECTGIGSPRGKLGK
jgi:subtilase family serine protease